MPDFKRIDRELAAIGSVPEAVQPLLDQYGQRDRSLENVDEVLAALRDGRSQSSHPPDVVERPSFLPLGWDADRKSDPGLEAAPILALEREEVTVTSGVPDAMSDDTSIAPPEPVNEVVSAPSALNDDVSQAAPEEPDPEPEPDPVVDTQQSSPPPPAEPRAPQPAPAVSASFAPVDSDFPEARPMPRSSRPPRPDLQALLDAELDPREFPSTPPRPARSSLPPSSPLPPVPRSSLAPVEPAAQEADFELLVDDDDILEIDEEES